MVRLVAESLTQAAFAPFGRVLDPGGVEAILVNDGRGFRRDLARFSGRDGRFVLARYDLAESTLPVDVGILERHQLSDQTFIALTGGSALIVVAGTAPDGSPDLARARAFVADPDTPFLYAAGTWHAPLYALGGRGAFLMGMHENGTRADCEAVELLTPLRVENRSWGSGIR